MQASTGLASLLGAYNSESDEEEEVIIESKTLKATNNAKTTKVGIRRTMVSKDLQGQQHTRHRYR